MARFKNFLAIFIVSFCLWLLNHGDCLAYVENFDALNISATSSVKTLLPDNFGSSTYSCLISTTTYETSPYSIGLNGVSSIGCHYNSLYASSSLHTISLDIYIPDLTADNQNYIRLYNNGYSPSDPTDKFLADIYIQYNYSDYGDVMMRNEKTSEKSNLVNRGDLTTGWHSLNLGYDENTNKLYGAWDNPVIIGSSNSITVNIDDGVFINSLSLFKPSVGTGAMILKYDNLSFSTINTGDVEIIELPDSTGDVVVMGDKFTFENPLYCTIGYTCKLWFNYNLDNVGDTVYLVDEDITTVITSQELIGGRLLKDYLNIPAETESKTVNYIVVDEGSASTTAYQLQVIWSDENTALLDLFAQYNCENICNDLATSTNLWEQIDYGLQCATRKGICWLFVPDQNTLISFSESINTIKNNFPFTVYNQIKTNIFDIDLSSTTATTIETNNIVPGLDVVLASSTMMTTAWGSVWTSFYQALTYIVYLLGFSYFVWRLFSITQKKDEDNI